MRTGPTQFSKSILPLVLLLVVGDSGAQIPVDPDAARHPNGVLISWPAEPNGQYTIEAAPGWDGPFANLFPLPLFSPLNLLVVTQAVDNPQRFFKVSQRDLTPPRAWSFSPPNRAIGVSRRTPIKVSIYDEGVIETNSISISITNGPRINVQDPRLVFTDGQIIFTPGPGPDDLVGDFGDQVDVSVALTDRAGNLLTNVTWSFQLELAPVLDPDVIVVTDLPPGLVLLSTNAAGDLFTYQFSGDASGVTAGKLLVSSNDTFSYRRTVVSVTEDLPTHVVEVTTANAGLADCLSQGSIQFSGNFTGSLQPPPPVPPGGGGQGGGGGGNFFQPAAVGDCCSVNLTGRTLFANADLSAEVISGLARLQPQIELRGNFNSQGLHAMDLNVEGELIMDILLRTTNRLPGTFTNRVALGTARSSFAPDFAGPVPAGAGVDLSFELVLESAWQSPGTLLAGLVSTNLVSVQSQLRAGVWTNSASRLLRLAIPAPEGETNPAAQIRVYVEVKADVDLDGLAGTSLSFSPTLDIESVSSAPPGQIGYDLLLFEGLHVAVSIDPGAWDRNAPGFALTNVLSLRQPIYHASRSFKVGSPLKPVDNMVWIPPGRFRMGQAEEGPPAQAAFQAAAVVPPTEVTLTEGFFMGRYEVTQREFAEVMSTNTSRISFHAGGIWETNLDRPMENISWEDASNYCWQLTLQQRATNRIPVTYAYRLPTEAEWEYACRAGTTNRFYHGEQLTPGFANYDCSTDLPSACPTNPVFAVVAPSQSLAPQPISVGRFAPNLWGLYDMHGNVSEWCLDWLGPQLPAGPQTNLQGQASAPMRTMRGGSYQDPRLLCQSASRTPLAPNATRPDLGFRVVLAPLPIESYTLVIARTHLIANQLIQPDSRVHVLFPPIAMTVFKFNPNTADYVTNIYDPNSGWSDLTMSLVPGEAIFVQNNSGAPFPLTFSGTRGVEVPIGVRHGLHAMSRQVPEPATFETITGQTPEAGTGLYRWNSVSLGYDSYTFDLDAGGWNPSAPTVNIGEGVFIQFP